MYGRVRKCPERKALLIGGLGEDVGGSFPAQSTQRDHHHGM